MEGKHHSKVSSQNGAEQERGSAQVVPRNHCINSKKIRFLSYWWDRGGDSHCYVRILSSSCLTKICQLIQLYVFFLPPFFFFYQFQFGPLS